MQALFFDLDWANELIERCTVEVTDPSCCRNPIASVLIHTYNHGPFLAQALDSVLQQQLSWPFEILVGDDSSSDGAQDIGKLYQRRHPDKIRLLFSTENLGKYTGGGRLNLLRSFQRSRGKYIAYLEGDDYWTDPDKLGRQLEYLEKHSSSAGCFHDNKSVTPTGQSEVLHFNRDYWPRYNQRDCLLYLKSAYASASLVFRAEVVKKQLPDYYLVAGSDFLLDLVITEYGTLDYLPFIGCAYRIHSGGSWSGASAAHRLSIMLNRHVTLLRDPEMKRRYSREVKHRLKEIFLRLCFASRQEHGTIMRHLECCLINAPGPGPIQKVRLLLLAETLGCYRDIKQRLKALLSR